MGVTDSTTQKAKKNHTQRTSEENSDKEEGHFKRKTKSKDIEKTSGKTFKDKKDKNKYISDDDDFDEEGKEKSRKKNAIKGQRKKHKSASDDDDNNKHVKLHKELIKGKGKTEKKLFQTYSERNSVQQKKVVAERQMEKSRSRSLGPLPSEKRARSVSTGKSDVSGQFDLRKPTQLTLGSVLSKADQRFPKQHQYYFEKLLEIFPELDLSTLLLPYVCFKDGQLYYKFMDSRFYQTYSHV